MQNQGHCVVITGGTRGIGAALGRKFLKSGNHVIAVGRSDSRERQHMGGDFIACDLQQAAQRAQLAAHLIATYPDLNVLINNAGVRLTGAFHNQHNYRNYAREIELNINAAIDLTDRLLPVFKARSHASAIVNVSSSVAIQPDLNSPIYSASKAFMHSFSTSLRRQLSHDHVQVIDLLPPSVDTEMKRGLRQRKISPAHLANIFWHGWLTNKQTIYAGQSRFLYLLNRISPVLAQRVSN